MATRAIPQSYYYSGQGRLLVGDRNPTTGEVSNFIHVGNVTALSIDITIDKFEHKESQSGNRSIDLTIIKEKKATIKFTAESLSFNNLALGLYGEHATVTGDDVEDEPHKYTAGGVVALLHPNVSAVVVKTGANVGAATVVNNTEYTVDAEFGTITPKAGTTAFTGANVYVTYTYGDYKLLDAFTKAFPDEKCFRFEGLNTVNGDAVLTIAPRVALDPLTGFQLINEELGSAEFNGNILQDTFIAEGSQFFTQRIIAAA